MPGTGWTAGHAATKRGNLELLELLLSSGADQNILAQHRDNEFLHLGIVTACL